VVDGQVVRLADSVLIEAHEEWAVSDRRCLSESSIAMSAATPADEVGHRGAASGIVLRELTCTVRIYTTTRDETAGPTPITRREP